MYCYGAMVECSATGLFSYFQEVDLFPVSGIILTTGITSSLLFPTHSVHSRVPKWPNGGMAQNFLALGQRFKRCLLFLDFSRNLFV